MSRPSCLPLPAPTEPVLADVDARATEAAALDLPGSDAEPALRARIHAELRELLERSLAAMGTLIALADSDGEPADGLSDAWGGLDQAPTARRHVADVCFASRLELRPVARALATIQHADESVVAAETGRRKLRRGVRAILEAAREAGSEDLLGGPHQDQHRVADLAPALSVRRLYATFRRSLRAPADDSPEAVLAAVRYAGGALAALITSPDYSEVRASDRVVLRRLRERALTWARGDRNPVEGLRLIADLDTTSDLLRGINDRQELRAHDRAAIAAALAADDADGETWRGLLEGLRGLDDDLDDALDGLGPSPDAAQRAAVRDLLRRVRT
jgi:hypothetical protein